MNTPYLLSLMIIQLFVFFTYVCENSKKKDKYKMDIGIVKRR